MELTAEMKLWIDVYVAMIANHPEVWSSEAQKWTRLDAHAAADLAVKHFTESWGAIRQGPYR